MVNTTWTQTAGMSGDTDTDNIENYAEQAEASKDAAAASETAAAGSASAASTSASSAATDAASALSSKNAAAVSETNAATSETNAASSAASASTSATNANTSASNSATSAAASASSAAAASTSETNSASSAAAALVSENAAASSETAASASASAASTSEANASASETAASASETAAQTAQAAAEAAEAATEALFDQFGDQYLGPKASDPTVDNDGNPLAEGAVYFNTTDDVLKFYSGSAWVAPESVATTAAAAAQAAQAAAETAETNAETAETNAAASASSASSSASAASTSASEAAASAASINLSSIDIDGGTIDGTVIGGSTPAAGSFTTGSFTGNVAHGDNVKATFGNSADLQVFHDGNNSYVSDQGQGVLYIQGSNNVQIESATGENMAVFLADNAVELYYDNIKKLNTTSGGIYVAGKIEVTGGGSSLFDNVIQIKDDTNDTRISFERQDTGASGWIGIPSWDDTALKIYGPTANANEVAANYKNQSWSLYGGGSVKLATTSSGINVTGTVVADGATFDGAVYVNGSGVNLDDAYSLSWGDGSAQVRGSGSSEVVELRTSSLTRLQANAGGDISFYEDTGSQAKLTWDASDEALEFGDGVKATFGASADLQIFHDGSNSWINEVGTGQLILAGEDVRITTPGAGEFMATFGVNGAATLYYDNSAKIATTSTGISVTGSVELNGWTITESGGSLYFDTGGTNKMKLDASGNLDVVGSVNSNATIT